MQARLQACMCMHTDPRARSGGCGRGYSPLGQALLARHVLHPATLNRHLEQPCVLSMAAARDPLAAAMAADAVVDAAPKRA